MGALCNALSAGLELVNIAAGPEVRLAWGTETRFQA